MPLASRILHTITDGRSVTRTDASPLPRRSPERLVESRQTGAAGLTGLQAKVLAYLRTEIESGRPSPSFDQIKAAMGFSSKSHVHRAVAALEERGRITRLPNRARSITLVQRNCPHCGGNLSVT